jgi:alanine racemase
MHVSSASRGPDNAPALVTHLASADDRRDPLTARQVQVFEDVTRGLPGERSLANSAGLLGWPTTRGDWVRPGLALYGATPFTNGHAEDFGLRPVMTLQSEVIAVKTVRVGETVGLWCRLACRARDAHRRRGRGLWRRLSAQHDFRCAGRDQRSSCAAGRARLDGHGRGRRHRAAGDRHGDPVVLWGEGVPVEEVARCAGTIPYELLCGVSQRVQHEVR